MSSLAELAAGFGIPVGELENARTNAVVGSTLLLENGRVRVWDITLAPGERLPFHRHDTTYFYRCESGGSWRLRTIAGEVVDGVDVAGQVTFHEIDPADPLVHDLANTGTGPLRYTTVELIG